MATPDLTKNRAQQCAVTMTTSARSPLYGRTACYLQDGHTGTSGMINAHCRLPTAQHILGLYLF